MLAQTSIRINKDEEKVMSGFSLPSLSKIAIGVGTIGSIKSITNQFSGASKAFQSLSPNQTTSKIKDCESIVKKLPADKIPVSGTKATKTGELIQNALKSMKYGIKGTDGVVGSKTVKALNQYIEERNAPSSSGFSFGSLKKGFSKAVGADSKLEPVKDASEITGAHVKALVDDLRDKNVLPANSQMLQKFAESMYEIGGEAKNPELQKLGRELSKTPLGAQSALQTPEQNDAEVQAQVETTAPTMG